jgi:hypothetical protein
VELARPLLWFFSLACSLTTDFAGLTGGANDTHGDGGADAADATSPLPDAATPDAAADAPDRGDGSADGGADALGNDAGEAGPCAAAHFFCDDFDDGGLGARWDTVRVDPESVLELATDASVSAPRSLHVKIPVTSAPLTAALDLDRPVVPAHRAVTLRFALKMDTYGHPTAQVFLIHVRTTTKDDYELAYITEEIGAIITEYGTFADGGGVFNQYQFPSTPLAQWSQVEMSFTFVAAGSPNLVVKYDGNLVLSQKLGAPNAPIEDVSMTAGIDTFTATDPFAFHIDDVTLDLTE